MKTVFTVLTLAAMMTAASAHDHNTKTATKTKSTDAKTALTKPCACCVKGGDKTAKTKTTTKNTAKAAKKRA